MKYKSLELKEFVGKKLGEVMNYLLKTYPGQLATEEDLKNLDSEFKDSNLHYGFGSLVRGSGGGWGVPYAGWSGSEWLRYAHWLVSPWDSSYRVVLLEIENCPLKTCCCTDSLDIEKRLKKLEDRLDKYNLK